MKHAKIDCYSHRNVIKYASEPEYNRDHTQTIWNIGNELILTEKSGYRSVELLDDVKNADIFYLVYAVYSTGDSFGRDEDSELEIIAVYKKAEDAFEIKAFLESHNTLVRKISNGFDKQNKELEQSFINKHKSMLTPEPYGSGTGITCMGIRVTTDVGSYKFYPPWIGYFERLSYINIQTCIVKDPNVEED